MLFGLINKTPIRCRVFGHTTLLDVCARCSYDYTKDQLIFIAMPYSDPNPEIEVARYNILNLYLATLFKDRKHAIAPVAIGHPIVKYGLPGDYAFWRDYSIKTLKTVTEVHVLMLEGWFESTGVNNEIDNAEKLNIPIKYIDPDTFEIFEC